MARFPAYPCSYAFRSLLRFAHSMARWANTALPLNNTLRVNRSGSPVISGRSMKVTASSYPARTFTVTEMTRT